MGQWPMELTMGTDAWLEVLELRRHEIKGTQIETEWIRHLERHLPACPARNAIVELFRHFPILHAGIFIGPPLPHGAGPEHEMSVMDPGLIDAYAHDLRPGGYVSGAGYLAFGSDADGKDPHFIGPHPNTGELTVLQIFRSRVKRRIHILDKDQYTAHSPSLSIFFQECTFGPPVEYGHPPRK